jgi:hypothetical protein
METKKGTQFFHRIGGRKQFNCYIATFLLTAMAPLLGASFPEYSFGLLGALGMTSGLIYMEDEAEKKYGRDGRMNPIFANSSASTEQSELPSASVTELESVETVQENPQSLQEGTQRVRPNRETRSLNGLNLQVAGGQNSR